jgi:hypothetical protein
MQPPFIEGITLGIENEICIIEHVRFDVKPPFLK